MGKWPECGAVSEDHAVFKQPGKDGGQGEARDQEKELRLSKPHDEGEGEVEEAVDQRGEGFVHIATR